MIQLGGRLRLYRNDQKYYSQVTKRKQRYYWKNEENQREFMLKLFEELKLKNIEDWKHITASKIIKEGGGGLLNQYKGNFNVLLLTLYPNHFSDLDSERKRSNGYWKSIENQKEFMDNLLKELFITPNNLNFLSHKHFHKLGGSGLLDYYHGNLSLLLSTLYPKEHLNYNNKDYATIKSSEILEENSFEKNSRQNFWKIKRNQRDFMDNLFTKLNLQSIDDWVKIKAKIIKENGGRGLYEHYKFDRKALLSSIYPDHQFNFIEKRPKFVKKNKIDLTTIDNQRIFIEKLIKNLDFHTTEDLKKLTISKINQHGGRNLLKLYGGSIKRMLTSIYPSISWHKKEFRYWKSLENQKEFMMNLFQKYNLNTPRDWIKLRISYIISNGGVGLLRYHNWKLPTLLQSIFPDIEWKILIENSLKYNINRLKNKYQIERKSDWYRIETRELQSYGGISALQKIYPDHNWNNNLLTQRSKKSAQRWLLVCVSKLFPTFYLIEEYNNPLLYYNTSKWLNLDLFIPSLNLAFEYQGEQHYHDKPDGFSNLELYNERDTLKYNYCSSHSISLHLIPYWWDKSLPSLFTSICHLFGYASVIAK